MSVLIVDDNETFCRFLAEILEARGMKASWTTDGLAGYEMSLRKPFDLFILDVRMPLVLGTEFSEGLIKDNPKVKIILISAFADDALRRKADELGVPLLSKPFGVDRLLDLIGETLGRHV